MTDPTKRSPGAVPPLRCVRCGRLGEGFDLCANGCGPLCPACSPLPCPVCAPGPACRCPLFRCKAPLHVGDRDTPSCFGAADDLPDYCDDCWDAAHAETPTDVAPERPATSDRK